MKNCSQKNKSLVGIKELHYRFVSAPEQWDAMLQDKYGIPQSKCSKKHQKGVCWLFAKSETEFDKYGNVRKSSRKVYNTQLHTEFSYQNAYDVHCRLVQWEMSMQQNGVAVQFPQSVLLQPTKMVFSYNEYGGLASTSDGKVESTFEYKYDESDNWITRYQIVNGKCVEIIVRQLKYRSVEECIAESDVENEPEEEMKLEEVIEEEDEVEEEEIQEEDDAEEQEEEEDKDVETEEEDEEDDKEDDEEEDSEENEELGFDEEQIAELEKEKSKMVGKKVAHKKYGVGSVEDIVFDNEKYYISITFRSGEKKFYYPDAFEKGYLELL